jgi:hypothetical protein
MTIKHKIQRVWVDDQGVYARTEDGLEAGYPFAAWKRLANATTEQRQNFYLSYTGIHWPDIDEDLSFEGMFANAGLCQRTETEDSVYFTHEYGQIPDFTNMVAEDTNP